MKDSGTPIEASSSTGPRGVPYAGFSWPEALSRIAPHLPAALVDEKRAEEITRYASTLPSTWHWGMFETRLGPEDVTVDLLGAMAQGPETSARLRSAASTSQHPGIRGAKDTLMAWSAQDGSSFARTPNLWMEWDQDQAHRPPLAWLCIAPHFFDKSLPKPTPQQIGDLAAHFMATDPSLNVEGASERLVELAKALPGDGQLMGFASLKPRGRSVCRAFANLPRGGTRAWLDAIRWPGSQKRFAEIEPLFVVPGEREWCQIEFDSRVGPHLALELAQTERGFPRREAREAWLSEVCTRGWGEPTKGDAVMNWHGEEACSLDDGRKVRLLRSFHVKLVLKEENAPQAKAYLGFYFRKPKSSTTRAPRERAH